MDDIELKEEHIDDAGYIHGNSENKLTELALEESLTHNYDAINASSFAFENSAAACHFFFPGTENERKTSQNQVDPLAFNQSVDSCVYQSESISIDDELLALETFQTTQLSSFSIIDPQKITKPNIFESEVKPDLPDQAKEKIVAEKRKRTFVKENNLLESLFPPIKQIKLEERPIDDQIILKKALVCIGPKLPLPVCLQLKVLDNAGSISTNKKKPLNTSSLEADQQITNERQHIVIKVFSCSKCNLKHTDSALHAAHIATCVSTNTCDDSASGLCSYKDRNGLFCCEFCVFKFKHKGNLISHYNKHIKRQGFACCVCSAELGSVQKLQNHYRDLHKKVPKLFCCNICEFSSITAMRLKEHMIMHISDKHLYCYKCRQNYEHEEDYNQHACKSFKQQYLKRKKLYEVHKSSDEKSIINHHSVELSYLKSKFESEVIKINDTYCCNGCSYTFSNYDCLVKHKNEHLKYQPYKCSSCKYESFSVVDMGIHVKNHLSEEVKSIHIKCNVCFMTFDKWKFLKRHAVCHVYDELYCSICRVNFENSESLNQHISSSHKRSVKDKMYSCSKCSFSYPIARALRRHMKLHLHRESKVSPVCKAANDGAYSNLKYNVLHENENLASDKYTGNKTPSVSSALKCKSCRIRFDSAVAFAKHNKSHLSKSSLILSDVRKKDSSKLLFKCNKCKYECCDIDSLADHLKFNHLNGEKLFSCSVCNYKIKLLKTYLLHLKSHSEVPTYCCQYCKYHTRTKKSFLQHCTKHSRMSCPMCVYSSHRFQALKNHVARQHSPRNGLATFVCTVCPYTSSNENVLSVHALKFHPKEYPSLNLPVPNYLQRSVQTTGDKLNACGMCPFTCHRKYDLKRHLTTHFVNGLLNVKAPSKCVKKKSPVLKSSFVTKLKTSCKNEASISGANLVHYGCSQCSFRSKLRNSVYRHLLNIHKLSGGVRNKMVLKLNVPVCNDIKNDNVKIVNSVTCQSCEVDKFSIRAQKQHRRLGHNVFWARPFSCPKCKSRFKTKMYVDSHDCINSKAYLVCSICNKYKTGFEKNMKNHSKICVKSSTTTKETSKPSKPPRRQQNNQIQTLNRTEDEDQLSSGDESFSCGECNFVTLDVTELIQHMFTHSGILDD